MNIVSVETLPIARMPTRAYSEVRAFGFQVPSQVAARVHNTGLQVKSCFEEGSSISPNHREFYAWRTTGKDARCVRVVYIRSP